MQKLNEMKQKTNQEYKYRILEFLKELPTVDKKIAINRLPIALEVPRPTFTAWCYLKEEESRTIPAEKLYQLATYFDKEVKEMFTSTPDDISYEQIKQEYENSQQEKFNV